MQLEQNVSTTQIKSGIFSANLWQTIVVLFKLRVVSLLLLSVPSAPAQDSLLATVPEEAYVLVHCRDVAGLRARAERNDWYRLLGGPDGEQILEGLAYELRTKTHSDMDDLLAVADGLEGEVVFFDDFEDVVGVSVSSATFADLLRYRMHLALYPSNPANLPVRVARY